LIRYCLPLALLLVTLSGLAAQTTFSWGPKLGFNLALQYGTKADEEIYDLSLGLRPGLSAGAFLDLNINPYLSLVYELNYIQKGSRQDIRVLKMENEFGEWEDLPRPAQMHIEYDLDYLEFPILLKVKTIDLPRWSLSTVTGTAMALKIGGRRRLDGTVWLPNGDDFDEIAIREEGDLESVNMFDYSLVYGTRVDLKGRLPLFAEYRFTLGWDYLILPTYQLADPAQLRNQSHTLILGVNF
jgi:hypothetical protein